MKKEELITISFPYYTGKDRTVRVYVPEHEDDEKLPVIYMTDGQNLFESGRPGQYGCWYTREAVREERQKSGHAAVIVGIHNDEGPLQRTGELLPKSIGPLIIPDNMPEELRNIEAEGELFDDFVLDTVMPYINSHFPVKTDRRNTAFCGSSSGGLQTFFTAVSHSDVFCAAGVFSPAFIPYDTNDVIGWTYNQMKESMPFLYFFCGGADPLEKEICTAAETVYEGLMEFYPYESLKKVIMPDKPHHECSWEIVFKDLLHMFLDPSCF